MTVILPSVVVDDPVSIPTSVASHISTPTLPNRSQSRCLVRPFAMATGVENHFSLEKEVPIGPSFTYPQDIDSSSPISSLAPESVTHSQSQSQSQIPASPSSSLSYPQVSGQGSSDESSEVAPEIVVWTEDMDLSSSSLSTHDPEDSSGMHLDTE